MIVVSFPDSAWRDGVGPVDGIRPVVWDPREPAPDVPIEVVIAPYLRPPGELAAVAGLPSVRLVQLLTAGYDGALDAVPEGVAVANAAGVHDASTAELAVGLALAALRGIPEAVRSAEHGEWLPLEGRRSLADRRVLVLGYGSVGRAIARRLQPFEVSLCAVASRARAGDDVVEVVHGVDELLALLPRQDLVIVSVPLTEATRALVDEEFLAALPDGSVVVNVARGQVADTAAVLRHAGRLTFALDVTDPEPLPTDHPLWSRPGVLITPHVGGATSAFRPRAVALLRDQLARLGSGRPPRHLVRHATYRPG
jgi:phosphoglycerate dehydrogenase-like enzyme